MKIALLLLLAAIVSAAAPASATDEPGEKLVIEEAFIICYRPVACEMRAIKPERVLTNKSFNFFQNAQACRNQGMFLSRTNAEIFCSIKRSRK